METTSRLKSLRLETNLTQKELAKRTGIPLQSIINYENGRREPNAQALAALERYFQVSVNYILGKTDEREPAFKWQDPKLMDVVVEGLPGQMTRILNRVLSRSDHDKKMFFDILCILNGTLSNTSFSSEVSEAAFDLLQDACNISERFIESYISCWKKKEAEQIATLLSKSAAEYLNVLSVAHTALNATLFSDNSEEPTSEVAVYDWPASAGTGSYLDSSEFTVMEFPDKFVPRETSFGVRIKGDSMFPELRDGDIVFVKRQSSLENGDMGIFVLNGEVYCKRYELKNGQAFLESTNRSYAPIELKGFDSLSTLGLVVGHMKY